MTNTNDDNPPNWPDDRFLTRDEAAGYARAMGFRLQPSTLAKFASLGTGPMITYFGRKPYYRLGDLREWLERRTRRSRSTTRRTPRSSDRRNDRRADHVDDDDRGDGDRED